jgi:hypothetical protein
MKKVKNTINKLKGDRTSASGVSPSLSSISAPTVQSMPSAGMQNSILSRLVRGPKEIGSDTTTLLSLDPPQLEMFKQRMQSRSDLVSKDPVVADQERNADCMISLSSAQPSSMQERRSINHEQVVPISGLSMMPRSGNLASRTL